MSAEVLSWVVRWVGWTCFIIKFCLLSIVTIEFATHVSLLVLFLSDAMVQEVHLLLAHSSFLIIFSNQICHVHHTTSSVWILLVLTSPSVFWSGQSHTFKFIVSLLTAIVIGTHYACALQFKFSNWPIVNNGRLICELYKFDPYQNIIMLMD